MKSLLSRIATTVARAAAVALMVEVAEIAIDRAGIPADGKFAILRRILKAGVGAAGGAVIGKILHDQAEEPAGQELSN
jgi:hypothetical protein